jgi:mRNA interferase MazF
MSLVRKIFKVKIYFQGTSGPYKSRPVLVIDYDQVNALYTIAEITSVPPNLAGYYDKFKEPIIHWRQCGLVKASYVKCKNIHRVEKSRLFEQIGIINADDFINIVEKIIEYNL